MKCKDFLINLDIYLPMQFMAHFIHYYFEAVDIQYSTDFFSLLQDFPTSFSARDSKRTKLKKELIDVDLIRGEINIGFSEKCWTLFACSQCKNNLPNLYIFSSTLSQGLNLFNIVVGMRHGQMLLSSSCMI